MEHKCIKCDYYYITNKTKTEARYNALADIFFDMDISKTPTEACGFTAGGVFLDKEQPRCGNFKETL